MAVQLRAAPAGFLSGWTAGRLAGLRSMPERPIHFTVPQRFDRELPTWVDVHRSRWYDDADRCVRDDQLVVAQPLRMLFGLAAAFNQYRFERAAEDAWHLGLITPTAAAEYLQAHRCRGKDGVATMERWLDRAIERERPTQSNLERVLIDALEQVGLPDPERQWPLVLAGAETIRLDIAWPSIRLAVEPGASWWHGGDQRVRRDQARDRACTELGWLVVRFDETMRSDVAAAAEQVARIHRRRTADLRKMRMA
ncbi:MAG: hypothetical protein WBP59_05580 [Ilumatobacteraceae bacterium]